MACMCGDICCPSCGPAQGNSRCPACGRWASDGECDDPVACEQKSKEIEEALAAEYRWEMEHADEIAKAIKSH